MKKRSALVFGASGLVGSELINLLLIQADYESVITFGRSQLNIDHPKLTQIVADFKDLESHQDEFLNKDVYCCLGTTIKKAKTQEAFRKIDFDYVIKIASIASSKNVANFAVVSSIGAKANSNNFYLKTKGEMEAAVAEFNFDRTIILQPSILLGDRKEKRFGEKAGIVIIQILNPLLLGKLKKYRGVHAKKVAQKMIESILNKEAGTHIIPSDQINL